MSNLPSKLQRWLDIVAYLAARRLPVSTEELWAHVPAYAEGLEGSSTEKARVRRMFERDKVELRDLGIPIEKVDYTVSFGREQLTGYRIAKRNFHLPYLKLLEQAGPDAQGEAPADPSVFGLSIQEAGAALDGLRELASVPSFPLARAARGAFRKLAFDLDPRGVGETPIVYAEDPESAEARGTLRTLTDAVRRRKGLTLVYHAMSRDAVEERHVHGYGLLFQHGRWYLVAHDADRDAVRMFRVGRIRDVEVNGKSPATADYSVPGDFSLEEFAGRSAWELGGDDEPPVDVTVRFAFPRSLWADRNRHGELEEEAEDGSQLRRFEVHRADPFLRWVLSLAGDARIEAPDDLRDEFQHLARQVAELHAARSSP